MELGIAVKFAEDDRVDHLTLSPFTDSLQLAPKVILEGQEMLSNKI